MNTQPKEVHYRLCTVCGHVYGTSGGQPFKLAQLRYATTTETGICPDHKKHQETGK